MWLEIFKIVCVVTVASCAVSKCVPRDYGYGSVVCVCNSTYCDTVEEIASLTSGVVLHYVSSKAGKRLEPTITKFSAAAIKKGNATSFTVNQHVKYQEMLGFGGASSDSATINTYSLSNSAADNLIRSYFARDGIGYSFIRVPLGGTDFSTHHYAYMDNFPNDTTLQFFNLSSEDFNYKIPFIKRAEQLSPQPVKLFTAAWSPPDWMKNIDPTTKASSLKPEYYQLYADYIIRFLDAYAAEGLKYWGLTPQNEPRHGRSDGSFNSMGWYAPQMLQFVAANLCPTLKDKGYGGLNVMITDNQRIDVFEWIELFENKTIYECATGMAMHWYTDTITSPHILNNAHKAYPEKFLLYTEACITNGKNAVELGNWERGEQYMTDIIEVTNHWVAGWVDWNMALDVQGGPSWINSPVDAPVIVNATADEFYKQPTFYALAHFAKFVLPGSFRIGLQVQWNNGIENVAFLTPDNVTIIILHNKAAADVEAVINDPNKGSLAVKLPATSFSTLLYK